MKTVYTEADFEQMCWHDCHIWGFEIHHGDTDDDDWTSELALDIDWIAEWPDSSDAWDFLVGPALLVFKGVTDLSINIDYSRSECHRLLPNPASIRSIEREELPGHPDYPDSHHYSWRILINDQKGLIAFIADGFTQHMTGQPVKIGDRTELSWRERERLQKGLVE